MFGQSCYRKSYLRLVFRFVVFLQIYLLVVSQTIALANPVDPTVVAGAATFNQNGNTLSINTSDRAIINWQGFSIAAGETTQFIQPDSMSAVLNRVTSGNPSALLGTLQANGRVFLINPNGILVGEGANINVGGLVASTLDINNNEFMRGGDLNFKGDSTASVINRGSIRALEGDIYMIGAHVENHGLLQASHGTVGMAAGQDVLLVDSSRQHLVVRPNANSLGSAGVVNTGMISAVQAELAANGGNVYALAINNTGVVRANAAVAKNGRIYLTTEGGTIANSGTLIAKTGNSGGKVVLDSGDSGKTNHSGTIDVSGNLGGTTHVLGNEIELAGGTIDASGTTGGGVVLAGGDYQGQGGVRNAQTVFIDNNSTIKADALDNGDGGKVIVWSDGATSFAGNISARGGVNGGDGGFAEVSGKESLTYNGMTNLSAPSGNAGWLLLDPPSVDIDGAAATAIGSTLGMGTNVRITSTGPNPLSIPVDPMGNGDVDVNASIVWDDPMMGSGGDLEILAIRNVNVNDTVISLGDGSVTLVSGWDGVIPMGAFVPTATNFGNTVADGGDVILDAEFAGDQTRVHSVFGDVNIFARNLEVLGGSDAPAVLGSVMGSTHVTARGFVALDGGETFAQVGIDPDFLIFLENPEIIPISPIMIHADGEVDLLAEEEFTYTQIGHGGPFAPASIYAGDIDIHSAGVFVTAEGYASYSMIGHGGAFAGLEHPDDIELDGALLIGDISVHGTDEVALYAPGEFTTAQIGHGGPFSSMLIDTEIIEGIEMEFDINLLSFIGQEDFNSDIMVNSVMGSVELHTEEDGFVNTAQIGHGGIGTVGNATGMISVDALEEVHVHALGESSNSQIGHGGIASGAPGLLEDLLSDLLGDVFIDIFLGFESMGDIDVTGGEVSLVTEGAGNTARVGHGGFAGLGTASGNINVMSNSALELLAFDEFNSSQIGHGGPLSGLPVLFDELGEPIGDFEIPILGFESTGNVLTWSNDLALVSEGFGNTSQIGHGGLASTGVAIGDIDVIGQGEVNIHSFDEVNTSQIGHGGAFSGSPGFFLEEIDEIFGDLDLGEFILGFESMGHISVAGGGIFVVADGSDNTSQIGHGGYNSFALALGNIDVLSNSELVLFTQDGFSTAQIGHGGAEAGFSFIINPLTDGPNDEMWPGGFFAQGNISVISEETIFLNTENGEALTSQIGHGGMGFFGTASGSISVISHSDIFMANSDGSNNTSQIGHGGANSFDSASPISMIDTFEGDITVHADGNLALVNIGAHGTSQIGHGGFEATGNGEGNIDVWAENIFLISDGFRNMSQIGHGSHQVLNGHFGFFNSEGDIVVLADDQLVMVAGGEPQFEPFGNTVQIGHGGFGSHGVADGSIFVRAFDVTMLAGFFDNASHIGHGGVLAFGGPLSGMITVIADHNLGMLAEDGSIAQIGHGALWTLNDGIIMPAFDEHEVPHGPIIIGDIIVATDQINPQADNGGRLFMNRNSKITMGGAPNEVRYFGTRRLGNMIEDGANFNEVLFNSSLPMGSLDLAMGYNENEEFVSWDHEQWGFYLGGPAGPYTEPFTHYFLGEFPDIPNFPGHFAGVHDCWERYVLWANTLFQLYSEGMGNSYYRGFHERPEEENTGSSSARTYGEE